jgi:hypothetical protein
LKGFFPNKRRRILHLVLRLLSARGLRPLERYVHREGRVDQRGHRPASPPRDVQPHGTKRRRSSCRPFRRSTASATRRVSRADGESRARPDHSANEILRALGRAFQYNRNDGLVRPRARFRVPRRHGRDPAGVRRAGRSRRALGRRDSSASLRSIRSPVRPSPCSERTAIYPAKHFITSRPTTRASGTAPSESS